MNNIRFKNIFSIFHRKRRSTVRTPDTGILYR